MTKDDAYTTLLATVAVCTTDPAQEDCNDRILAAAEAYADDRIAAALADPLALLEAALGAEDGFVVKGWQLKDGELTIQRIDGRLHYLWEYPDRIGEVTREEVDGLLAGKGDEHAAEIS